MEVNLSYLKGVRTRYRNTLERAIQDGENILSCDVSSFESDEQINKIGVCSQKIKTYIDKLEVQTEKVVCSIDESDSDYLELVLEEDSVLQSEAMDCHLKLQQLKESLMSKKLKEEVTSHPTEQVSAEHLLQINKELQHMLYAQMEQQTALFEKQSLKDKEASSAVRLPKLDISPFSGDKLKWLEFWDSFTSSIHENKKLSDIEKFTYLRSKLNGEALRSILGIHLSGANYLVAIKTLNERFGNSQEVIDLHYNELINLKCVDNTTQNLRSFNDKIDWHLRSLEVLDQNVNQAVFVSIVKSKLPKEVLFQLELKNGTDGKWTIQKLREHLSSYIIARERSQTDNSQNAENVSRSNKSKDQPKKKPKASYNNNKPSVSSSEALVANTNTDNRKSYYNLCRYCEMEHWSDECPTYTTIDERKRRIQGSCYKCLKVGHMAKKCKSNKTCVHCGEVDSHHRSLCPKKFGAVSSAQLTQETCLAPEQNTTEKALISSGEMVLMQTALTEVKNPHSALKREVRILLDSGSQRTYITEDLARKLGLKSDTEEQIKLVTFGSDRPTILKTKVVKILLKLNNGSLMELSANVVPVISGTVSRKAVKVPSQSQLEHLLNGVKLSDTLPKVNESSTVELLIGNDYYLDIILSQKIEVQPGLYLLASKLGWILTGRTRDSERDIGGTSMLILTHGTNITKTRVYSDLDPVLEKKPDIEDFWNIKSIGVKDNVCDSEDEIASNEFKRTLKFENGRYQVTWPWKSKDPELPRNRELAVGRLRSVVSKLKNKSEVLKQYNTVIEDQLEKGVIEKVESEKTDSPIHYLPHHAVINPTKPTTKLRVVYDASAKANENKDNDGEKTKYESKIRLNKGSRREQTEISAQVSVSEKSNGMCIDINKYSSFTKLIRVTALVLRFIRKLKKQKVESEHLTSDDLQRSEDMWIQNIQHKHFSEVFEAISKNKPHNLQKQLGIFVDEKGILRCKGRLEFSCLSEGARQPILLPARDPFTSLLINKTHEALFHSGVSQTLSSVRMKYWILQGRSAVRSVLRQCHVCRRHEGGPYKLPKFSPLPSNRVTESTAFSRTGVDYFGPIYVKSHEGPTKVWVCLFTCLVTRAVHLELVQDMTSAEFLMCLKRFISQRGAPVEILSDNAKQFKAADTCLTSVWKSVKYSPDVQNYISSSRIKWTFTVEMAPWMGGTYERLVGVVKRNLRKALGKKLLSFIQLQTLLKEIEAVVNSRPLAYVGDDINSTITLTPAHFLTLNPRTGIPESEDSDGSKDPDYTTSNNPANQLLRIWKKGQIILNSFWRLWRNEYLTSLRERTQSHFKHSRNALIERPKVGDVVLIKDESPRGCWRMGKITEIRQSKDGEVRSARVLLASGRLLSRPINLLYPIETSCENELREKSENMHYESTRCEKRPKRQSAITAERNIRKMLCGKGVNTD